MAKPAAAEQRRPGKAPAGPPLESAKPAAGKRRQLVDNDIYTTAAELFSAKGFKGTSLQDIADAMGLSRPALYHYVSSKEEILSHLVEEFTESKASEHALILSDATKTPVDKLGQMVALTVRAIAQHPVRFRLLERSENELPQDLAKKYLEAKRAVRDAFVNVIAQGVRSGHFRPVDEHRSAFGLIGMCTWVAWWSTSTDTSTVESTVDEITALAVSAVLSKRETPTAGHDPASILKEMREQITFLERMLVADPYKL